MSSPVRGGERVARQSADMRVTDVMLHRGVHRELSCAALGVTRI
ncbi:hypothetical protein [Paenibacillus sp. RC84]